MYCKCCLCVLCVALIHSGCVFAFASSECVCVGLTAYLLIQFTPTQGQSDDSVVRQLLSCYLK